MNDELLRHFDGEMRKGKSSRAMVLRGYISGSARPPPTILLCSLLL